MPFWSTCAEEQAKEVQGATRYACEAARARVESLNATSDRDRPMVQHHLCSGRPAVARGYCRDR